MKDIMIATDGSENVKNAISYGIEIAKATGCKVHAVYVVSDEHAEVARRDLGFAKAIEQNLADEGKRATADVEEAGRRFSVVVESILLKGRPVDEIINYSEKNDVDMIVMGTLGLTGVKRLLIGSVAENVVRHSKVPVLVVR
ncbi:universal stress protein [Methanococcoides sp. FTZ1]|uniref:universal stress protein n=1 Tax=Methanococcoides sp. FTZ1 TaxID=3439061 RepID=UPI003F86B49A